LNPYRQFYRVKKVAPCLFIQQYESRDRLFYQPLQGVIRISKKVNLNSLLLLNESDQTFHIDAAPGLDWR
jgi:hypothetical protein